MNKIIEGSKYSQEFPRMSLLVSMENGKKHDIPKSLTDKH